MKVERGGKLHFFTIGGFLLFITLSLASTATAPAVDIRAASNESIVVVTRNDSSDNYFDIIINDQNTQSIKNGQTVQFVIQNGENTIEVKEKALILPYSRSIIFTANHQRITFSTSYTRANGFNFQQTGVVPLQ